MKRCTCLLVGSSLLLALVATPAVRAQTTTTAQPPGVQVAQAPRARREPLSRFEHIVVLVQENRAPDNLFQGLCAPPFGTRASCSTTPTARQYAIQVHDWLDKTSPTGVTSPAPVPLANQYDLRHTHAAFVVQCDLDLATGQCRMDGAAAVPCSGTCPSQPQFRYVDNASGLLNPYLELATQYGWANAMFQTNQGPSFPAHQFIFGGTAAPSAAADAAGTFASENTRTPGGTAAPAGCSAPARTVVQLIDANGTESAANRVYPCFEHETVPDLLPSAVSWRYYAPNASSIWTAPNAIEHICQSSGPGGTCLGQDWTEHVDLQPADVLSDIASCQLRNMSWVIPTGANSDHANGNDGGGPSWVASIVNAIGTSTSCDRGVGYWHNTAILITWDDWGGWYDHVAPPRLEYPEGGYQLGFRVPLLFVSAYTPTGAIDNARHDFGSMLRFIEHNFGVPEGALNFADARATTRLEAFVDFRRPPRRFHPVAAEKDANFFVNDARPATDPDDD